MFSFLSWWKFECLATTKHMKFIGYCKWWGNKLQKHWASIETVHSFRFMLRFRLRHCRVYPIYEFYLDHKKKKRLRHCGTHFDSLHYIPQILKFEPIYIIFVGIDTRGWYCSRYHNFIANPLHLLFTHLPLKLTYSYLFEM